MPVIGEAEGGANEEAGAEDNADFLVKRADAVIREHRALLSSVNELRQEASAREQEIESLRASIRTSLALTGKENMSEMLKLCFSALDSQNLTKQVQ